MEKIIQVKVFAGAKKEKVENDGDKWTIYVREPAQNNLANMRIRELIATAFNIPRGSVRIRTGHKSPKKTLTIML